MKVQLKEVFDEKTTNLKVSFDSDADLELIIFDGVSSKKITVDYDDFKKAVRFAMANIDQP